MTSSIFLPRRSRAWPDPRTHLTASTMLVFPEPLGPTIAVTPPSKRISVGRANVLKPSRCSERRNKLALGYQRGPGMAYGPQIWGSARPEAQHVENSGLGPSPPTSPRRWEEIRLGLNL